jgi:hypothetical protein
MCKLPFSFALMCLSSNVIPQVSRIAERFDAESSLPDVDRGRERLRRFCAPYPSVNAMGLEAPMPRPGSWVGVEEGDGVGEGHVSRSLKP